MQPAGILLRNKNTSNAVPQYKWTKCGASISDVFLEGLLPVSSEKCVNGDCCWFDQSRQLAMVPITQAQKDFVRYFFIFILTREKHEHEMTMQIEREKTLQAGKKI